MEERKRSIKEWAEDDRPREKMIKKGISALSNAELIAILFGTGTRNESAVELARKLLASVNDNLNNLARLSLTDLQRIKGIGEAKATTIVTALELGKRRMADEVITKRQIQSSRDVFEVFGPRLGDLPHEEFWVLLLKQSNVIIDDINISKGGIAGTVTDIRLILKAAIEKGATSMILCHNHPSGSLMPSEADIQLTKKLKEAGRLVDIAVIDHLIVSAAGYYSFADTGAL